MSSKGIDNITNSLLKKKYWKKSPGAIFSHFVKGIKSSSKQDLHSFKFENSNEECEIVSP